MRILTRLNIVDFKSIRLQTLELGPLNIFIGGNGSGKSNLIEIFRFLREIVTQNLAGYVAIKGGADTLMSFGRRASEFMGFLLKFGSGQDTNIYEICLHGTDQDTLIVWVENVCDDKTRTEIASHSPESKLRDVNNATARQVLADLESCRVYHFHDTSDMAAVKGTSDIEDNRFLRPQAENLAAFLYYLQEKKPDHYANIRDAVRQIASFFDDFNLAPSRLNENKIRLEWKEKGSDAYFNASSFSDGTLRFICLATLLLQPDLPTLILLDEPELGLHPAAITLLADLLSSAATRTQVIVATQSVTLINQFDQDVVWTVDRQNGQSVFRHLKGVDMRSWLDGYALGELWEKNVLGARP